MLGIGLAVLIGVTVIFDKLDPTKGTNASQSAAGATSESSSDASAPEHLTKLIDHCDAMTIGHGMCGDLDKPVWKSLTSDTGEITRINMNSIQPGPYRGTAFTVIYTYPPGTEFSFERLKQIYLTCHGQFADTSNAALLLDAPPGSVIGMVAAMVCPIAAAKGQAIELQQQEAAMHPRPEDYCQGFSADACARIQAGVNAKIEPSFCKDGFADVGSGLTDEQTRVCFARLPIDDGPASQATPSAVASKPAHPG
jgi:hypothetical protein